MNEPVTFINAFSVSAGESEGFLRRWKDNARIMARRPGFIRAPRLRTIAYWVATLLLAAEFGVGGVMDTVHLPPFFPTLLQLGYPAYFGVILGVWKVLGATAVLAPRLPRAKEWAYAGMVINLTSAIVSTVAMGGGAGDVAVPLAFIGLVAVSWALRPPSRRLP